MDKSQLTCSGSSAVTRLPQQGGGPAVVTWAVTFGQGLRVACGVVVRHAQEHNDTGLDGTDRLALNAYRGAGHPLEHDTHGATLGRRQ